VKLTGCDYEAVFLPELGMLGSSLKYRGLELLSLHGGAAAFRQGHTTGLPLLAPWANRLARQRFRALGAEVDVDGSHADPNGLPIHGTMVGPFRWHVVRSSETQLVARYRYEARPEFPFAHELEIHARLGEDGLRVRTALRPTGRRRVPVSFGWHPYFRLTGTRGSWLLRLPARRHLELDELGIPTGRQTREAAEEEPLARRTFDDLYALGRDRRLGLAGAGRRVEIRFGSGYAFAQVYAPPGKRFVALEPMTAATNALVGGTCPVVRPGERFAASFTIRAA